MKDNITKEITDRFLRETHKYILSENSKKDIDYYSSGMHCSSIGYCRKKAILQAMGARAKEHNLTTLMTFRMGNTVHEINLEFLDNCKSFELLDSEIDISDGLPDIIKGRYDFRAIYKPFNKIILGDTKSAHPSQFRYHRDKLPHLHHIIQLSCYAEACTNIGIDYDLLAIFYWDKGGTNQPEICFVGKIPDIKIIITDYLNSLNEYRDTSRLPIITVRDIPFEKACEYCEYWKISCDGASGKEDFYEFVKKESNK